MKPKERRSRIVDLCEDLHELSAVIPANLMIDASGNFNEAVKDGVVTWTPFELLEKFKDIQDKVNDLQLLATILHENK